MRMVPIASLSLIALLALATSMLPSSADAQPRQPGEPAKINSIHRPPGGMLAAQTGGNTVGDVIREAEPRADGYRHIDTPATIRSLQRIGVNTYVYLIWNSPTDWQDLIEEFAPAAAEAKIDLWLYLVPPSECQDDPKPHLSGRCSRPFEKDYVRWAEEIAKLSVRQPNVLAWALDDFFSQLSPEQVAEMQRVQKSINPNLGFYTTVYYDEAVNPEFYERYEGVIDGIIYPYTGANSNTQDASRIGPNLDLILAQTEQHDLGVVLLAYTGRYLSAIVPPTDRYVYDVIKETQPYLESGRLHGITLYGLPIAGGAQMSDYNRARTGAGWLSLAPEVFARTKPGDHAQAEQTINVDPDAGSYSLEFSDFDTHYDQYGTATTYHTRQVLIDGEVVWESDRPGSGGTWHRRFVDLTEALQGKKKARLTLRLTDKTGLSLWTGVIIDDVVGHGITIKNGGFESRGGWAVSTNNSAILPGIHHFADFDPDNALEAAARAFRGRSFEPSRRPGEPVLGDAMYGSGRLRLAVEPFTRTTAGTCVSASQRLAVDPDSPRYEIDFFQFSPHATYPGFLGAHQLTVTVDGETVWTRDANSVYPFWENGNGLQGPVDVTEFVQGKENITLSFRLCGLQHSDTRPNPAIDIGFDRLRTVGLRGENFDFEDEGGWTFDSDADGLSGTVLTDSTRAEAPPVAARAENRVARAGSAVTLPVMIGNESSEPLTGTIALDLPDGWNGDGETTPLDPVPAGGSATVDVPITVPAGTAEGSYWVIATAETSAGTVRTAARIQVVGTKIEFTPGTVAEGPWLDQAGGSQLDGEIFDGRGRFADGATSFTYRFDLPADVTGGTLTLHIGNQFKVSVSEDVRTWRTVLTEEREIRDLSNLQDRTLDLADLDAKGGRPLFVKVEDSFPTDGWGGWLGRLTLTMITE